MFYISSSENWEIKTNNNCLASSVERWGGGRPVWVLLIPGAGAGPLICVQQGRRDADTEARLSPSQPLLSTTGQQCQTWLRLRHTAHHRSQSHTGLRSEIFPGIIIRLASGHPLANSSCPELFYSKEHFHNRFDLLIFQPVSCYITTSQPAFKIKNINFSLKINTRPEKI